MKTTFSCWSNDGYHLKLTEYDTQERPKVTGTKCTDKKQLWWWKSSSNINEFIF